MTSVAKTAAARNGGVNQNKTNRGSWLASRKQQPSAAAGGGGSGMAEHAGAGTAITCGRKARKQTKAGGNGMSGANGRRIAEMEGK